ncbi:MAG: 50S ribosomal protein L29 [Acidobacteria bacterium]|nr:MAG: 50S ribosomal protein L29 [Acidobacteriota bacterium]
MKSSRFRDMPEDELHREEQDLTRRLFDLRCQLAVGRVENPQRIRAARRDLARVKTRLRSLELERAAAGKAGA